MRFWQFWLNSFILSSQYNPPRFVEMVMILVALVMLIIWTFIPEQPYIILGWSFVLGASISILVREAIAPSAEMRINQIAAFLFIIISLYGFIDAFHNL